MKTHRHVDWSSLPADAVPRVRVPESSGSPEFGFWLSLLDELLSCDEPDAIIRRAIDVARERIGLVRVSIYLRDEACGLMRGTWGTNREGATVDEHFITFDVDPGEPGAYERAARAGVHWLVVDNAPMVSHSPTETCEIGRGWVCCTPIRGGKELLGTMFNDAGLTDAPIDDGKQARVALLCSLVGSALLQARKHGSWVPVEQSSRPSPAVAKVMQLLARDPAMTGEELGGRLRLSASRIARVFKGEMGLSLVEYRNRLRLERFSRLLDEKGENLLEAALEAGFGSYAQFHRVFTAQHGTTPGRFLRGRPPRRK